MLSAKSKPPPSFTLNWRARQKCPECARSCDFAQEEMKHKAKLEAIKAGGKLKPAERQVMDMKLADYIVDAAPSPDMNYQGVLILAMKKEKAAFRLYSDLASSTDDENAKTMFLALAQEEAKHKLRFEIEYDDMLAEN
jgi:rubrerythrin